MKAALPPFARGFLGLERNEFARKKPAAFVFHDREGGFRLI